MEKQIKESENASSRDFVKERIKARPINKSKLVRKSLGTILSSLFLVLCSVYVSFF